MATDSATIPAVAATVEDDARTAGQRILQLFSLFVGGGYLFYLVLVMPNIAQAMDVMETWWTVTAVVLIFGTGLCVGIFALRSSIEVLRRTAAIAAIGFLVAMALWPLGWTGDLIDSERGMWFTQFNGLAAIVAAAAWRGRWAFVYLIAVTVVCQLINHEVRAPEVNGPVLPEMAWGFAFCLVPFAAAVMGIRTAGILDATRESAYAAAAEAAGTQARALERTRFDALTHDGVMSTLLGAARQGASERLASQAKRTLADMDGFQEQTSGTDVVPANAAVAQLRSAVVDVDPTMTLDVTRSDEAGSYPVDVVLTVAAATSEAVRNSVTHAGAGANRAVAASFEVDSIRVDVVDDGVGFDPRSVPPQRLGLAVSIRRRLAVLDGGSATVESHPGRGTRISIMWSRP
ncbi:UNVERIFIED_CONTAM: signal transduction histidine kinase [Williamsia faeni]